LQAYNSLGIIGLWRELIFGFASNRTGWGRGPGAG